MTDQWVPAPPQPPPPDPPAGLPPANSWSPVTPCAAADSPKIADGVIITGRPAIIAAMPWTITLNDGLNPPNFTIDRYDASGVLIEHPIDIDGTSGDVTLTHNPTQPLGVVTKQYVDAIALTDAPNDGSTYARRNAAWTQTVPSFGGTFSGGVAFTAGAIFAGPANLSVGGGAAAQVLSAVGSGGSLAWANLPIAADAPSDGQFYTRQNAAWAVAPGGMTDAPNDGTAYARKSGAWAHLTHLDITDWAATLANYYPTSNPSGYQTAAQVTAALAPYALTSSVPVASTTPPLMNGTAAVGTGATWARADHVHASDTSRYAATNPSGYQTAAQVATSLGAYLPLAGGTLTGQLTVPALSAPQAIGDNRIINGDMRIDQRNGGASGTATNVYTVDRWQYLATQAAKGTWGRSASNMSGFPYCLAFNSSSAYASLAADYFIFRQPFEADQISDFQWGASNAQPITLSFWVASSLTGTFSGCISNYAGTRSYPFTYTISAANTNTRVVVTIPGDTGGTWVMSGNAGGALVYFDLGCGSTNRGPASAWASASYMGVTGSVSVVGTNAATFFVTGVKLEIGSVATPFNRQSLAKSMADCQRYYQQFNNFIASGYTIAGGQTYNQFNFQTVMRAAPSITGVGLSSNNLSGFLINTIDTQSARFNLTITATGLGYQQGGLNISAEL